MINQLNAIGAIIKSGLEELRIYQSGSKKADLSGHNVETNTHIAHMRKDFFSIQSQKSMQKRDHIVQYLNQAGEILKNC